jgi:hypothetical protein
MIEIKALSDFCPTLLFFKAANRPTHKLIVRSKFAFSRATWKDAKCSRDQIRHASSPYTSNQIRTVTANALPKRPILRGYAVKYGHSPEHFIVDNP